MSESSFLPSSATAAIGKYAALRGWSSEETIKFTREWDRLLRQGNPEAWALAEEVVEFKCSCSRPIPIPELDGRRCERCSGEIVPKDEDDG